MADCAKPVMETSFVHSEILLYKVVVCSLRKLAIILCDVCLSTFSGNIEVYLFMRTQLSTCKTKNSVICFKPFFSLFSKRKLLHRLLSRCSHNNHSYYRTHTRSSHNDRLF